MKYYDATYIVIGPSLLQLCPGPYHGLEIMPWFDWSKFNSSHLPEWNDICYSCPQSNELAGKSPAIFVNNRIHYL